MRFRRVSSAVTMRLRWLRHHLKCYTAIHSRGNQPPPRERMMPAAQTQEATQTLAAFAATLKYQDLPERVREHTKNVLLDTLACAVAGHQGEETGQVHALASALAESRESS